MATHAIAAARTVLRELHGVVVSAGLMEKTVKVRVGGRKWNAQIKKYFNKPQQFLVHDPNDSLRAGDVVAITPGWRTSKHKRHVVKHIISPAQVPVEERPPVPTEDERWAEALIKRAAKVERKTAAKVERLVQKSEEKAQKKARKMAASQSSNTSPNDVD